MLVRSLILALALLAPVSLYPTAAYAQVAVAAESKVAALQKFSAAIDQHLNRVMRADKALGEKVWNAKGDAEGKRLYIEAGTNADRAAKAVASMPVPPTLADHKEVLELARSKATLALELRAKSYALNAKYIDQQDDQTMKAALRSSSAIDDAVADYQSAVRTVARALGVKK